MKPRFYDRHWLYPEITGQLSLVMPDDNRRQELFELIKEGDNEVIDEWIKSNHVKDVVKRLIRLGFPADEADIGSSKFDEILLGHISYEDGPGTVDYLYTRRFGKQFITRVYFDGSGNDVYSDISDKSMSKREFVNLTRWRPWLESGSEDETCESHVSSIWDR